MSTFIRSAVVALAMVAGASSAMAYSGDRYDFTVGVDVSANAKTFFEQLDRNGS
ncbi:MAG: hypothetical protein ACFCUR_06215 [Rhodomicrobiaceae bacterium]